VIHKTFEVDGSPDIEVRFESGRVEVRRGSTNQVDVRVDTSSSGFIVEQRGNSILVSSDKTTSWLSRGSAYVEIETPEGSDLTIAVASAQIEVDVPLGKVDIKTASGDIEIDRVENLTAKTASGDTRVEVVERSLRYTSASGDLFLEKAVGGSVTASTASGDIEIEDCGATVDIATASGDTRLGRFTGHSANFKTMSGTIDIGIPRRTEVSLDARLLSGKLRIPDPEDSMEPAERQVSITAKLVSGDLRINRAD
jgi:DUF4097 and DUF4098 domain-containing protein YvlB